MRKKPKGTRVDCITETKMAGVSRSFLSPRLSLRRVLAALQDVSQDVVYTAFEVVLRVRTALCTLLI